MHRSRDDRSRARIVVGECFKWPWGLAAQARVSSQVLLIISRELCTHRRCLLHRTRVYVEARGTNERGNAYINRGGDRWHLIAPKYRIPRSGFSMHRRSKKPEFATLALFLHVLHLDKVCRLHRALVRFSTHRLRRTSPPLFLSLLADPLNEHKHKLVSSNRAAGRARSLRTVNWWVNLLRWMSEGVGFFYGCLVLGEGRESFLLIRFG